MGHDDKPQSLTGLAAVADRFALDSDQLKATSLSLCHGSGVRTSVAGINPMAHS